jgi:hypothetical protein
MGVNKFFNLFHKMYLYLYFLSTKCNRWIFTFNSTKSKLKVKSKDENMFEVSKFTKKIIIFKRKNSNKYLLTIKIALNVI